jgi:hypothetical protein
MYELWVTDGTYIQGTKLGRGSKTLQTLKARATKHFGTLVKFTNELESTSACIWIELPDRTPVGLIQPKGD